MRCVGLMNKLLMLKCSDLSKGKFEQGADDRRMVVPGSLGNKDKNISVPDPIRPGLQGGFKEG